MVNVNFNFKMIKFHARNFTVGVHLIKSDLFGSLDFVFLILCTI